MPSTNYRTVHWAHSFPFLLPKTKTYDTILQPAMRKSSLLSYSTRRKAEKEVLRKGHFLSALQGGKEWSRPTSKCGPAVVVRPACLGNWWWLTHLTQKRSGEKKKEFCLAILFSDSRGENKRCCEVKWGQIRDYGRRINDFHVIIYLWICFTEKDEILLMH